jgi:hypothetical protein
MYVSLVLQHQQYQLLQTICCFSICSSLKSGICIGVQKGSTSHCQSLETQACCCELQRIHGCVAGSCCIISFRWLLLPFLILISLAQQHWIQVLLPAQFLFQVFSESKVCQTSTFICQFNFFLNRLKICKRLFVKICQNFNKLLLSLRFANWLQARIDHHEWRHTWEWSWAQDFPLCWVRN